MKCICLAWLLAASVFGYPTCGNGQIKVGSLANCSVGDVELTNWSFSAPGYKGNAMVQVLRAADYDIDPEVITLHFANPLQSPASFTFSFLATFLNGYEFNDVAQRLGTGKVPNTATVTGTYNGLGLTTDGLSTTTLFAQGGTPLSETVHVSVVGLFQSAPSICHPASSCKEGNIQDVEISLYQSANSPANSRTEVSEPVTTALVGMGLLTLAAARKRRALK